MKIPDYIKPGSRFRIVSPAGKVSGDSIFKAADWIKKAGYEVELGKHVFSVLNQFAGTDDERLEDLQQALDDPETDVILCSRGGYGTVRIIERLDFKKFTIKPKWIVGYSDITVLHSGIHNLGITSVHATMAKFFDPDDEISDENARSLLDILSGNKPEYPFKQSDYNRNGSASAPLVGGNLSILCSLTGTKFEIDTEDKILFIEDIDEYLYHTDRLMHQLKLAGKLKKLKGLVIGGFTNMKDNETPFGETVEEIILEMVKEYKFPVAFGFPAGHDKKNLALLLGKKWELTVNENVSLLKLL